MGKETESFSKGNYMLKSVIIGGFIGILADKLALGMIYGFFISAFLEAKQKKANQSQDAQQHDENLEG